MENVSKSVMGTKDKRMESLKQIEATNSFGCEEAPAPSLFID